ncbi:FAST kinase domain-containing protein 5 [Habropoda laboriosa]|uniref:FAST kinase domain-containing protein 5 n=1 Tax=Habropoda laboriosa TaxID=597456 RepID=A0A0L7QL52_9HYME|nr:PREDICTED: FAST kinase domain-containing protein 5, mitochondrial [Habropoda laboriosa]KOC59256.1 FAST kinase domain-containing protein 5 [Habropoda laboriosa]
MNLVARLILNYRCNHTKVILLRLFKGTHCTTWTSDIFQRIPREYKYFLPCCTYRTIADNKSHLHNIPEIEAYVSEHKILHSLFENSVHYKNNIIPPITTVQQVSSEELNHFYIIDWESQTAQDILTAIKKLTYCHIRGSSFEKSLYNDILQATIPKLPQFNDQMIKIFIQCLITLYDKVGDVNVYRKLLKALNKECVNRFYPSDVDEMLLLSDAFYRLNDHDSEYKWRAMRKLCFKVHKLSGKNLVQLLFLLNLVKGGTTSFLNMFEIECHLEECMYELSGNEIGIIARGFFLNKKKVRSKTLMPKILIKVQQCADTMDSTTLASVMKLSRYSDCIHCIPEFQDMLKSVHKKVPELSLKCLTHIVHTCASLRVYDKVLIDSILERTGNELKSIRLKDIERILYAICTLTPSTSYYTDICHKFLNEITSTFQTDRAIEIEKYSGSLARILIFLAVKDIYTPELTQHVFDPVFVQKIYKNNLKLLSNDLLFLHCCIQIDMPHYEGPLFAENIYEYLVKTYNCNDDVHRKDNRIKLRNEVVFLCKNKLGINVYIDYILPHHSHRHIVLGLDENNKCIDVEPILSKMPLGTIKYVNSDELKKIKWKVLYIYPALAKIHGYDGYNGNLCKRVSHIRTVGYTPLPVISQIIVYSIIL